MKKIAIFVEGLTERIFIDKFLREFIVSKNLAIRAEDASGGKKCPRFSTVIVEDIVTPETKFQILLFNSCTDNRMLSDLKDKYNSLKEEGYSTFIGIRDLYPDYKYHKKNEAVEDASYFTSTLENTTIVYATMEAETWFIGELNHYTNIDSELTLEYIKENLIDLDNITNIEEEISHPAEILHEIYKLKGKAWNKTENQINRTVNSLDYENLYVETRKNIPSLNQLITELDNFFF